MRGDRLKLIRELRGLSQDDLAQRAKMHKQQIYRYEKGESDPTSDTILRIAEALEVSTDYLLGLVSEPTGQYREYELSPMERRLIQAIRDGLIVEALESVASISKSINKATISPEDETIDG